MVKLLNSEYLSVLKTSISLNKPYYYQDDMWVDKYFNTSQFINKKYLEKPVELLIQPNNNEKLDFENAKRLYDSLKDMSLALAADERVWTFMTHITYWDYMRKRWPIENLSEKYSKENYIKTHYFFGERPKNRNGIARLWWIGHVTYDEHLENKFELTEFILKNQDQDLTRMIMETPTIARNRTLVQVILKSIKQLQSIDSKFDVRDFIRYATKYFNFTGSVTLWDSLDYTEIEKYVEIISDKWLSQLSINH